MFAVILHFHLTSGESEHCWGGKRQPKIGVPDHVSPGEKQ